ncbi:hypothetical protein Pmani_020972 [Petrolisthes manimaculis]|uniref:Endonuclease/exonuclease/phosphatase domain-containing protein n=1 Tax=Petrolisthes manimaculis TaxID=1843537 RepID=A0AAE1PH87_9EUCA|nr:hypothetical protein Pmani_020972 [Petrolisthes manimaculis]
MLRILQWNIYRLRGNINSLKEAVVKKEINVVLLQETLTRQHPNSQDLNTTHYHIVFLGSQHNNDAGQHLAMLMEETDNICLLNSGVPTHQAGDRLYLTFVSKDFDHCSKWWIHPTLTSDHNVIRISLEIRTRSYALRLIPEWNTKKEDWRKFESYPQSTGRIATRLPARLNPLEDAERLNTNFAAGAATTNFPVKIQHQLQQLRYTRQEKIDEAVLNHQNRNSLASKRLGNPNELRKHANRVMDSKDNKNTAVYYTDGSVDPEGATFVLDNNVFGWRRSDHCSSTQTELSAKAQAMRHAESRTEKHILIYLDSMNCRT